MTSHTERDAMRRALDLAATAGIPLGPNPRVGCVLLDPGGSVVAVGYHRGAGTPHAEADALARAGDRARGSTAVVTLEPCNHIGRTPPCAEALIAAGVRRVVFAHQDPNPVAAGGAEALAAAGIEVEHGVMEAEARELNRAWLFGIEYGRPLVTWKFAATLDGRSAAADGSSRWITNRAARSDVHRLRARCDAILVGTGTAATDDPALTARDEDDLPLPHQPLRVVMGERGIDPALRVLDATAETLHLRTRDPREALRRIYDRGCRHLLVEGGPTVAAAFLTAEMVDEIVAYVAPALLGAGPHVVGDLGVTSIAGAMRPPVADVAILESEGEEPNVRVTLRLR